MRAWIQDDDGTELEFVFFDGAVQNQQWHFITLVSLPSSSSFLQKHSIELRPDQEQYQLYLNGVLLGETDPQQRRNTNASLTFQDEIQLCPTKYKSTPESKIPVFNF